MQSSLLSLSTIYIFRLIQYAQGHNMDIKIRDKRALYDYAYVKLKGTEIMTT